MSNNETKYCPRCTIAPTGGQLCDYCERTASESELVRYKAQLEDKIATIAAFEAKLDELLDMASLVDYTGPNATPRKQKEDK